MSETEATTATPRDKLNCDREAWVLDRLRTVSNMTLALDRCACVGADQPLFQGAIDGLVNGAAIEIIRTLGLEPSFTNIRRV